MQVPFDLLSIQKWFAKTITWPINQENPFLQEAVGIILPNKNLRSEERIKIYNEQYWWRLLSAMQGNYPILTSIFGYEDFNNSLAIPFLKEFPSRHWSLNELGKQFPAWIDKNYSEKDKLLVYYSALIDQSFVDLFLAPFPLPFTPSLTAQIVFQEHVEFFKLPFDLFNFREELKKQPPEYWTSNDFPLLDKSRDFYFVLYRNSSNKMSYRKITQEEWILLNLIESEGTLEKACDALENMVNTKDIEEKLPSWIQFWIKEQFLMERPCTGLDL